MEGALENEKRNSANWGGGSNGANGEGGGSGMGGGGWGVGGGSWAVSSTDRLTFWFSDLGPSLVMAN